MCKSRTVLAFVHFGRVRGLKIQIIYNVTQLIN